MCVSAAFVAAAFSNGKKHTVCRELPAEAAAATARTIISSSHRLLRIGAVLEERAKLRIFPGHLDWSCLVLPGGETVASLLLPAGLRTMTSLLAVRIDNVDNDEPAEEE